MLSQIEHYSFLLYGMIIFVEGMLINGTLSILNSNEVIKIAANDPVKVDLITTAQFTLASLAVGVAQLMIGLFMASSS